MQTYATAKVVVPLGSERLSPLELTVCIEKVPDPICAATTVGVAGENAKLTVKGPPPDDPEPLELLPQPATTASIKAGIETHNWPEDMISLATENDRNRSLFRSGSTLVIAAQHVFVCKTTMPVARNSTRV